jgi:tetratricopeptide (TPR) repeat protein
VNRTLVVAAAMYLCGCPGPAFAQSRADYASAVEEYREGDPSEAIQRVARWPASTITETRRQWAPQQPAGQLVAALMLHTELGAAILNSLPHQTTVQLSHAAELLDTLSARRGETEHADAIRLHWYRFVISLFSSSARFDEADRYATEAIGRFPRDPELILDKGIVLELGAKYNRPPPARSVVRGMAPGGATPGGRTLAAAAAEYRRALEIDPHLALARLRLGWVRVQQGDSRGGVDLAAALADAKDDDTRYLAHLFLGGVAERRGDFDEAAQEYAAAHRLGDQHQTPFVALSRVELARGHADRARELARELAALERVDDDPWWNYHLGALDQDALQWLRDEAQGR